MQCSTCGFANPQGTRFCGQCGSALPRRCGVCNDANPADFKFCGSCGAPLQASLPGAASTVPGPPLSEAVAARDPGPRLEVPEMQAERRQITVMFCDLVGSTELASMLDPEEFRELLQAYQTACTAAIERFAGYVAQYLGDGILAYFGYPVAYDDEADRAVRAGLEIIDRIAALNGELDGLRHELAVRVGIHSGVVVISEVGGGSRREQLALGEVPNVAARLQGLAAPNSVVLSATSFRLVSRDFLSEDLGPQTIKGLPRPEPVYRVVAERRVADVMADPTGVAEPLMVGRTRELGLLIERWADARAGRGQIVVIGGEAGIGKSRLVRGFLDQLGGEAFELLEGRCLPYYQNTAFHPIIDLLHRQMNCRPEQAPQERLEALLAMLERDGTAESESLPVLTSLLSLAPAQEAPEPAGPRADRRDRERTYAALLHVFICSAKRQPMVIVLEDAHWMDPSTLDLADRLIREIAALPVMVVLTHRTGFHLPWSGLSNLSTYTLQRLDQHEVEAIVERVTEGRQLPRRILEQIIAKTDGVPLFVEELTKMILETGLLEEHEGRYELVGPLPPLAIPSTLHDSLEARLDRLATTKEVAQVGAAIGREFSYGMIRTVSGLSDTHLRHCLAQLVEAELLQQRGKPPRSTYLFKHALIQDAAYQSLLKSTRQKYHLRIAQVLEAEFAATVAAEPERLAQHYLAAGLAEQALAYWLQAGTRAVERSANEEALAHLEQARAALEMLPDTPERARHELALLLALGPALVAIRGYAAPEVRRAYAAAVTLSDRFGDVATRFAALCGLFSTFLVRMELDEAERLAERLLELAREGGNTSHLVAAHVTLGATRVEQGNARSGRMELEQALRLYNDGEHFPLTFLIGQDFGVVALGYLGHALWLLGLPDQALQRSRQALDLARRLDHPHTLAFALAFNTTVHYLRREPQPLLPVAEELLALAVRAGFHHWILHATSLAGWAWVELNDAETGLSMFGRLSKSGLEGEVRPHFYQRVRALALDRAGRLDEALQLLEAGDGVANQDAASNWRVADLYRVRGALLAKQPGREREAEEWLRRSFQRAAELGTIALELRAATGLVGLLGRTERGEAARRVLRKLYDTFEEGLDLPDLREARQLLGEELVTSAASA
jgi:class 3 adenylate cyclase/tetratricopeptide (TPR) repeat protein